MFKNKFRLRIIFQSILIVIFCFIMIITFGYNRIESVLLNNHLKLNMSSCEQKYQISLLNKELIENTVRQFKNDTTMLHMLQTDTYNFNVPYRLNSLPYMNFNIIGVMLFANSGFVYGSDNLYNLPAFDKFCSFTEYSDFFSSNKNSEWFLSHDLMWDYRNMGKNHSVLVYADKIFDNDRYVGALVLTIKTDLILSIFKNNDEEFETFLYTPGQAPLYAGISSSTNDAIINKIDNIISANQSQFLLPDKSQVIISQKFLNFNIITLLPLSDFNRNMHLLKTALFISMFLLSIILIFVYRNLTNEIFAALERLNSQIKGYRKQT